MKAEYSMLFYVAHVQRAKDQNFKALTLPQYHALCLKIEAMNKRQP